MRTILAISLKDLRLLLRDRAGLFFTFVFPLVYALFFGSIFSGDDAGDRRIPLRLVDLDSSTASTQFIQALAARPELDARIDSLPGAEAAVRQGRATAALVLPAGFGLARERLFSGEPPTVRLLRDPARQAEAGLLQGLLFEESMKSLKQRFATPRSFLPEVRAWQDSLRAAPAASGGLAYLERWLGELDLFLNAEAVAESLRNSAPAESTAAGHAGISGFEPLKVEMLELRAARQGPRSSFEISFPQGLIWGVISVAASFGISLVVERRDGTLRRLRAGPVRRRQILAGKALACYSLIILLCATLLLLGIPLGVRTERPLLLLAAVLSVAAAFTGIMQLISVLGRTERAAGGIGWSLMMVFAMLGGGMVPLFFMPEWMRTLGHVSPVKWSILALKGALWRGFDWAAMAPVCALLWGIGLLGFLIGLKAFRWSDT